MSTEHQQFSIENQMAVITDYAKSHDFEIIRTYSDEARSGIDLAHRPGLKQLLDDITSEKADFRAVLVYDVSRWGRFQDADESACYEFLCRRAGVNVVYCAELFANDLSVAATLLKTLRRTMAGEYLRELSAKVFAGQCRIVRKGYKAGGPAGYGLRRLLLTPDDQPRMMLRRGECKSLVTERVTYVPGPINEVRIVRKIYSLFLDSGLNCHAIARWLNERNIPREIGYKWNGQMVHKILSHAKYTGCIVFNQKSGRLRSRMKANPREQWVIQPNSFPAIISQKRFELAQKRLAQRVFLRTDEQLLQQLRDFVKTHGKATQVMLAADPSMATGCTYGARFGSFSRALQLIKTEPPEGFPEIERRARIKLWLQDEFARILAVNNVQSRRSYGFFISSQHPPVLLDVARCFALADGQLRWEIRYPLTRNEGLRCITVRLQPDNKLPMDYVFIPCLPRAIRRWRFSQERIEEIGFIKKTLDEILRLLLQNNDDSSGCRNEVQQVLVPSH
jgi:DNA invertase Pin-like site-specific DNA recombinase